MAFQLKTRVLLGLIAVSFCIVAAPMPLPADAPARNGTAQAAATGADQAAQASAAVPTGLERQVAPNLPFTGLDILTFVGVAVGLSLLAWVLYRLSVPRV
jgi:hypothetical protein